MQHISSPLYHKKITVLVILWVFVLGWALPVHAQTGSTRTFLSNDGTLTFDFPSEWAVDEILDGLVRIGSSQAILDADDGSDDVPSLATGEVLVLVLTPSTVEEFLAVDPTTSPSDMVAEFTQPSEIITEYQAGGRTIAYASADLSQDAGLTFGIDTGSGLTAIMLATHAVGEQDLHFETFLAIAESLHHPDFPLEIDNSVVSNESPGVFTTNDAGLTLSTPSGWDAGQVSDTVFVSHSDENGGVRLLVLTPKRVAQEMDVSDTSAFDVANSFKYILEGRDGASVEAGRAAFLDIGESIRVNSTYQNRDEVLVAVEVDDGQYAVVIASMPQGMRNTYEPVIFDIVESFSTSGEVINQPSDTNGLTQEYVNSEIGFQFTVPIDWVWHSFGEDTDVDDIGIMIFTDSENTYQAIFVDNNLTLGDDAIMLLVFNPDVMYVSILFELSVDATNEEIFDSFVEISGTDDDVVEDSITYEGNRNTILYAPFESNGLHGVYGIVDLGDNEYTGFHVLAETDDHLNYISTILDIADSMEDS